MFVADYGNLNSIKGKLRKLFVDNLVHVYQ